jgi:hypothetical protein
MSNVYNREKKIFLRYIVYLCSKKLFRNVYSVQMFFPVSIYIDTSNTHKLRW